MKPLRLWLKPLRLLKSLLIPLAIVTLFAFANASEDQDAKACAAHGGIVETNELPHQDSTRICLKGGMTVNEWKLEKINGKNVLVWDRIEHH